MFKNPLKYQQGGTIAQAENDLIDAVSSVSGVSRDAVATRYEEIKSDKNATAALEKAIQLFNQDKNQGLVEILNVFFPQYKLGGKIQDFICKHTKGGHVGCGCKQGGGIVKSQNGNPALGLNFIQREYDGDGNAVYFLAPEKRFLPVNMRQDPDSDYQQQGSEYQGNGQVSIVDFGNRMRINKDPYGPFGDVAYGADSAAIANRALELMKKIGMKPSNGFIQSKQEGGELTRREALDAGMQNKGYNRSQARFALMNAKNTLRNAGVRGREMRQTARQWVAGQNDNPILGNITLPITSNNRSTEVPSNIDTEFKYVNFPAGRIAPSEHIILGLPSLPQIDTNFEVPDVSIDEAALGNNKIPWFKLASNVKPVNIPTGQRETNSQLPNLPSIDTNFNIPDVNIGAAPNVEMNLNTNVPSVTIPNYNGNASNEQVGSGTYKAANGRVWTDTEIGFAAKQMGMSREAVMQALGIGRQEPQPMSLSDTSRSQFPIRFGGQPKTAQDYLNEYTSSHYPNGSKRNFISRLVYGQQRNLVGEQSPLFVGPPRPGTVQ